MDQNKRHLWCTEIKIITKIVFLKESCNGRNMHEEGRKVIKHIPVRHMNGKIFFFCELNLMQLNYFI